MKNQNPKNSHYLFPSAFNMRNWWTFLIFTLLSFPLLSQTPVSSNGALSVNGNRIVNENNEVVSFSGTSLFWSNDGWGGEKYYNADVVDWLQQDWEISLIRAAMGVEEPGGYIQNPTSNKNKVTTVVDAAIANGLYVIIDWHSHHAEDYQAQAISFFQEMATQYGNTDHVIYEIYNEPLGGSSWSNDIKPYAEAVISAIRAIDPDNLIIVGTPTWSQDVDVASANPINGNNIAYTLHFYAGTHTQYLRDKATTALNNGAALMVTEWGTVNASGDGAVAQSSTQEWVSFMEENDLSNANWSVNDKVEGASVLKPGASVNGGWSDGMLTESGLLVREITRNWENGSNGGGNSCDPTAITPVYRINGASAVTSSQISVTAGDNLELAPTAASGGTWSWTGPSGFTSNTRVVSFSNVQESQAGNYAVTYTNNCGTNSQETISIEVNGAGGGGNETCQNPTSVSVPFTKEGVDEACFETSGNISFVNSWSVDLLEINGVDFTNKWSNSMPAKIDGKYYIRYSSTVGWGHFEMSGSSNNTTSAIETKSGKSVIYPTPSSGVINIEIDEKESNEQLNVNIFDANGNVVYQKDISGSLNIKVHTELPSGVYRIRVANDQKILIDQNTIIK
ncbi:hypothetical protein GCM10011506_09110 [Marivirga lumbricoides]|uniref:Endoglucanase n=1 Tax=Marivirga lumbricoides TaxID=1046115 RepID=A0ABQ1LKH7_9BACT|nr:hypothetical protein GCM10011506_09110 [Marivirga lumbricoides]